MQLRWETLSCVFVHVHEQKQEQEHVRVPGFMLDQVSTVVQAGTNSVRHFPMMDVATVC